MHRLSENKLKNNERLLPLLLIENVIDKLQKEELFMTLSLKNSFFYVNIKESSRKYILIFIVYIVCSFITHDREYEFCVVRSNFTYPVIKFKDM